ncbi:hypothetical protein B0H14DRAFT_3614513 [Mycena olivaceomarginata]|nr:hypothetical protein B0H14DRAFT_3614513 [Mycena olivaceomarginata]
MEMPRSCCRGAPLFGKAQMDLFYVDLLPIPLLADHSGLPPTYIQICGFDPLRDEGLLYERLLREQGVPPRTQYVNIPEFLVASMFPQPTMMAAKKWEADLRAGLKWILAQEL